MSELMFVLKTLALTAVIALSMQIRIGGSTIENRTEYFLTKSSVAIWIQSAASGGALALNHFAHSLKEAVSKTTASNVEPASHSDDEREMTREQRAGR